MGTGSRSIHSLLWVETEEVVLSNPCLHEMRGVRIEEGV